MLARRDAGTTRADATKWSQSMIDEATRARRVYSINECLIRLMSQRVARECSSMFDAGATAEAINDCLPHIVEHYDRWREDALQVMMVQFDLLEHPLSCRCVTH